MGRNGTSGRFRMRRSHVGRVGVNAFLRRSGSAGCARCQLKIGSRKKLENLTEHATKSIHVEPPVFGLLG